MDDRINFSIPVFRLSQKAKQGQSLYVGKIKVKDLYTKSKQRFDINIWSENQPLDRKGYQRAPLQSNIAKITEFILRETDNPLFPTSILVSCHEDLAFKPSSNNSDFGELNITDTLWIIDGQHRVEAFKQIMSKKEIRDLFGDYELPITIMTGFSINQEIEQFFVINSRQKRVKTDLAQQIYMSLARENLHTKMIPDRERWKLKAIKVVENLANGSDYTDGVWAGRIEFPNEDKEIKKLRYISQNSFVSSLKPFFIGNNAYWPVNDINDNRGHEIVKESSDVVFKYWKILGKVYEKIFHSPRDYSLFKTVGVFSMHFLLSLAIKSNRGLPLDKILEIVEKKLIEARDIHGFGEGFWRVGNTFAIQKRRNAGAYSSTAGQMIIARSIYLGNSVVD